MNNEHYINILSRTLVAYLRKTIYLMFCIFEYKCYFFIKVELLIKSFVPKLKILKDHETVYENVESFAVSEHGESRAPIFAHKLHLFL